MAGLFDRVRRRFRGHDIFISYARADGLAYARALDAALRKKGFRCFRDERELRAGDHFPNVLTQSVKESTMLVTVLSPRALTSAWVQEELRTYLEAAGTRLVVPILFESTSIETLQGTALAPLKNYHGVLETQPCLHLGEVTVSTVSAIRHQFKALTWRTFQALALGGALLVLTFIGIVTADKLSSSRQRASRMEWQERAAWSSAQMRYDLAELALARAAAAEPGAQPELLPLYREARSHRSLTPYGDIPLSANQRLLQWMAYASRPAALLHDSASGTLQLHRDGVIEELPSCATTPLSAAAGPLLIWACGVVLHRWELDSGKLVSHRIPRAPQELVLAGDALHLLERGDNEEPWIRILAPSSLAEISLRPLLRAPKSGALHLCLRKEPLAYAVSVQGTQIHVYQWSAADGAGARTWAFAAPAAVGADTPGMSINAAWSTPRCDRLVVNYSVDWVFTSSIPPGFWARLYLADPRAARPVDDEVRSIVMLDDGAGSEAVILNPSGDMRRIPEVPFVMHNSPMRTVASGVHAFTAWMAQSGEATALRQIAVDAQHLLVFEDDRLLARYPAVDRPRLIAISPDGAFVAVEGHDRLSIWRTSTPTVTNIIPALDSLAKELSIDWPEGSSPRYRSFEHQAKALP